MVIHVLGMITFHCIIGGKIFLVGRVMEGTWVAWTSLLLDCMTTQLDQCVIWMVGYFVYGSIVCLFFFKHIPSLRPLVVPPDKGPYTLWISWEGDMIPYSGGSAMGAVFMFLYLRYDRLMQGQWTSTHMLVWNFGQTQIFPTPLAMDRGSIGVCTLPFTYVIYALHVMIMIFLDDIINDAWLFVLWMHMLDLYPLLGQRPKQRVMDNAMGRMNPRWRSTKSGGGTIQTRDLLSLGEMWREDQLSCGSWQMSFQRKSMMMNGGFFCCTINIGIQTHEPFKSGVYHRR